MPYKQLGTSKVLPLQVVPTLLTLLLFLFSFLLQGILKMIELKLNDCKFHAVITHTHTHKEKITNVFYTVVFAYCDRNLFFAMCTL